MSRIRDYKNELYESVFSDDNLKKMIFGYFETIEYFGVEFKMDGEQWRKITKILKKLYHEEYPKFGKRIRNITKDTTNISTIIVSRFFQIIYKEKYLKYYNYFEKKFATNFFNFQTSGVVDSKAELGDLGPKTALTTLDSGITIDYTDHYNKIEEVLGKIETNQIKQSSEGNVTHNIQTINLESIFRDPKVYPNVNFYEFKLYETANKKGSISTLESIKNMVEVTLVDCQVPNITAYDDFYLKIEQIQGKVHTNKMSNLFAAINFDGPEKTFNGIFRRLDKDKIYGIKYRFPVGELKNIKLELLTKFNERLTLPTDFLTAVSLSNMFDTTITTVEIHTLNVNDDVLMADFTNGSTTAINNSINKRHTVVSTPTANTFTIGVDLSTEAVNQEATNTAFVLGTNATLIFNNQNIEIDSFTNGNPTIITSTTAHGVLSGNQVQFTGFDNALIQATNDTINSTAFIATTINTFQFSIPFDLSLHSALEPLTGSKFLLGKNSTILIEKYQNSFTFEIKNIRD